MHEIKESEEQMLSSYYREELERTIADDSVDSGGEIEKALRSANHGVGARDLVVLAVSSFFAILLVLVAPLAKSPGKTRNKLFDSNNES